MASEPAGKVSRWQASRERVECIGKQLWDRNVQFGIVSRTAAVCYCDESVAFRLGSVRSDKT